MAVLRAPMTGYSARKEALIITESVISMTMMVLLMILMILMTLMMTPMVLMMMMIIIMIKMIMKIMMTIKIRTWKMVLETAPLLWFIKIKIGRI